MDKTKFFIEVLTRWADMNLQPMFVRNQGDTLRGLILIYQELNNQLVRIWVQETDEFGNRVFRRRFDKDITQEEADNFVDREVTRDEDLWIVIFESSGGDLPPVLKSAI